MQTKIKLLFNNNLKCELSSLIKTLKYIYKNINCDIINMSLGILVDDPELLECCNKLVEKGVIIIAAFDNAGNISYPAAYPCVIGVDSSTRCFKKEDYVFVENSIIDIKARGGRQRVSWYNPDFQMVQGTSFATPYITSMIARMIQKGISKSELRNELRKNAKYIYDFKTSNKLSENIVIKKASVFPYNKEVHSMLNFKEQLCFEIIDFFDTRYSGRVGKTFNSVNNTYQMVVKDIEEFDYKGIDTFIIGHVGEMERILNQPIKKRILDKCLKNKINVFCFDDENIEEYLPKYADEGLRLQYPDLESLNDNKFGKLYYISTPTIAIVGTSKQQGKFTLQMLLKQEFEKKGYLVGCLGSEPHSKLFGFDEMYPFGYSGKEMADGNQTVEYVNSLMHKIDKLSRDIIITSSQSGTVPMIYGNVNQFLFQQWGFLLGVNPDSVLLCVSITDSVPFIIKTINFIEGISLAKVIAIVVSPLFYDEDTKKGWFDIKRKKANLERQFLFAEEVESKVKRKVFLLENCICEGIVENIIDFFT